MSTPSQTEADGPVRVEVADGIATVRLHRPPMNVVNATMRAGLYSAAEEIARRSDVAAVVLYGGPKVFAAGADIKEMAAASYSEMTRLSAELTGALDAIARLPQPVVAAITGYALGGGCELALTADRRVAAADARLGQPEIKLGLIPGAGGTQRLPRLVGPARAKDLIFTGRTVEAKEALSIGLVDDLVTGSSEDGAEPVLEQARAWASQFVGGPAMALAAAKSAVDRGGEVDLANGRELERHQFAGLIATADAAAGMAAFIDKQTPTFEGR